MTRAMTANSLAPEQSLPLNIQLVNAARQGDPAKVRALLGAGADPLGFVPITGATALIAASWPREKTPPGPSEEFTKFWQSRNTLRSRSLSKRRLECIKILAPISNVNAVDALGRTALMATMSSGRTAALEVLLPLSNLDINDFGGDSALTLAAAFGNAEAVKILANEPSVGRSDADGHTALMLAAGRQLGPANDTSSDPYLLCFDTLLAGPHRETMPDPHRGATLAYIAEGGSAEIFKSYWRSLRPEEKTDLNEHLCQAFKTSCGISHVALARAIATELPPSRAAKVILSSLVFAATLGRASIVQAFATKDLCRSFSPRLQTPLMAALQARQHDSALVSALISLSDMSQTDSNGRTPLMLAIEHGPERSDESGGDLSTQEKERKEYALVLRLLATKKACARVDGQGNTPLMNALNLGLPSSCIGILAKNSDLTQRNPAGKCALAVAASSSSAESLAELAGRRQPRWCHTQALREALVVKNDAHAASLIARADQGAFDEFGRASFLQAVAAGCIGTVKALGADSQPHQRDLSLQNAFDVAIESIHHAEQIAKLLHALLDVCDLRQIEDYAHIRERLSTLFFSDDAAEPEMLLAHFDAQLERHELQGAIPLNAAGDMKRRNAL